MAARLRRLGWPATANRLGRWQQPAASPASYGSQFHSQSSMAEVCWRDMGPNRGSCAWAGRQSLGALAQQLRAAVRRAGAARGVAPPRWCWPHGSHHGVVARDAGIENLLRRQPPPVFGENLNFRRPGVARRLDPAADLLQLDDAITHHAAIVEKIARRQQPITDMVGQ